jgi:hypothetical protein
MFFDLTSCQRAVRTWCRDLDPGAVDAVEARAAIGEIASMEKFLAGARLRLTRCLEVDKATTEWLASQTGQSPHHAAKDVETAKALDGLASTDRALRDGELSPGQAREVTSAASVDPAAEKSLLDTARNASMAELKRKAKATRAAATDEPEKNKRAHRRRGVSHGTDDETGAGWMHVKGPAAVIAQLVAFLEPFVQTQFKQARQEGRHESRGAYAFDALIALFNAAAAAGGGSGKTPAVRIIARVDAAALKRGYTIAGETCDIEGVGPVPVQALLELLPQAAIDVIVTDGQDVFNVTSFARKANIRQQIVLHWLGVECAREGCGATRNLELDHRVDWAKTHVTELRALEWHCKPDHRRKTHEGWALVNGQGVRPMVPPDHPDHPNNANANAPPAHDTG